MQDDEKNGSQPESGEEQSWEEPAWPVNPVGAESPKSSEPQPPPEPAEFPKGFWNCVDYLLQQADRVQESLRQDHNLWRMAGIFFAITLVMAAMYGVAMGATNLLQGADMPLEHKLLFILFASVKLPVLFLGAMAIVLPPIYVSNAFVGQRLSFRQVFTVLISTCAVTTTVLASMATVAAFFALTSETYHFIKLLHVVIFAYAGLVGVFFINRCFKTLRKNGARAIGKGLLLAWLVLYSFVGMELAWIMRPYIGNPDESLQVFRARSGNIYESMYRSFEQLVNED